MPGLSRCSSLRARLASYRSAAEPTVAPSRPRVPVSTVRSPAKRTPGGSRPGQRPGDDPGQCFQRSRAETPAQVPQGLLRWRGKIQPGQPGGQPSRPVPPRLPPVEDGDAVEVERCVSRLSLVSLAGHQLLAAEILGGRRVGIRIEPTTLMFYDLASRELLRTRKNAITPEQVKGLRGVRPARPPPRPSAEPVRVQRRASNTGVIMVVGQKIALGRTCKHQTVTVLVSQTTLAVELVPPQATFARSTTRRSRSS
jgi:hypothetical protein